MENVTNPAGRLVHQGKRFKHTSGETPEQFEEERMLSTVRMRGAASIFM